MPGARVAVIVVVPVFVGVIAVDAMPLASVAPRHDVAPPQTERTALLVALQPMVAPAMGVTPSDATTRTIIGKLACVPTGVCPLDPFTRRMLSPAAAPYVSAPVMVDNAPVAGSVMVIVWGPSD